LKRVLLGVVWFFLILVTLLVVSGLVLSVWATREASTAGDTVSAVDAAFGFAERHAGVIDGVRIGTLLLAFAAAAYGSWKGLLPGTRKPDA
jgi:hypothetical protein